MSAVFHLQLDGESWDIHVTRRELDGLHRPLLRRLAARARAKKGRYVVFLAGVPGVGKTTIAALWEHLAREMRPRPTVAALPVDGFHFPNAVLDATNVEVEGRSVCLRQIKGAPQTFDLEAITRALANLAGGGGGRWPRYDRRLHDPIPDAIEVPEAGVCVVEGNYLLLDRPGWRDLARFADLTLFADGEEDDLRAAKIARLERGGRSPRSARRHYEEVDCVNADLIRAERMPADGLLRVGARRSLRWASPPPLLEGLQDDVEQEMKRAVRHRRDGGQNEDVSQRT